MIRRHAVAGAALALVSLTGAGCSTATAPTPSSFDLPGDVAFGCMRRASGGAAATLVDLGACRVEDDANDPGTHSLMAFVTQVATGEVAAVDLRNSRSIDSNVLVPGFTYVQVGEIPTGIVTTEPAGFDTTDDSSDDVPSVTYVSAFGSRSIDALGTASSVPDVVAPPFARQTVDLDEGPTDLVFVPVAGDPAIRGYLYAPLPALGVVAQVRVLADGSLDPAETNLALDPDPLNALAPAGEDEVAPYERICPTTRAYADATAPGPAPGAGTVSSPVKLALDTSVTPPVLLVADEASPVIHRLEVGAAGAAPLQGIGVGVPTTDVAVTPFVAATVDADPLAPTERYLYAIDAGDGTVLAVDYTPGSPTFGAILAANVGTERPDRIALRDRAREVEVITPELGLVDNDPVNDAPGLCDPADADRADEASPALLRGVFLTVGLQNGLVAVVDVWDLEAPCRGGASCMNPAVADDIEVAIRRHRPRIATFVSERPIVTGSPALSFETNPGLLDDDGRPSSGGGPGLAPVDCAADFTPFAVQGFPDPAEVPTALICLRDDPWAGVNQRFTATFDGVIPLSNGGNGRLEPEGDRFRFDASDGRFCEAGVLGAADVVASALGPNDPEAGYAGDQLEIIGDLPPETEGLEQCQVFDLADGETADDRDEPILFQIVEANDDSLLVEPQVQTNAGLVLECFPRPTSYRVRARDAYVVAASGLPMRHRVTSVGGACRIDTATFPVVVGEPDTYRNFRAFAQRTYVHPLVAFEITLAGENQDDPLDFGQESRLVFDVSRYPSKLALDLGSIPIIASMRWNPVDDRLYVVDEGQYQVAQIDTDAFRILRLFD